FYNNEERLLELTTEKAFALPHILLMIIEEGDVFKMMGLFNLIEMIGGLKLRTLHWDFAGSLEPPRVVSCRTEEALGKEFASAADYPHH
ncbi:hypothetical protein ACTXT7_017108, partial [Hymenolepis weldensis]